MNKEWVEGTLKAFGARADGALDRGDFGAWVAWQSAQHMLKALVKADYSTLMEFIAATPGCLFDDDGEEEEVL